MVAEALVRHDVRAIGMEEPGSVGVVDAVRAGGPAICPVPVDEDGLNVAVLAAQDLRAVFVTPAHQFPTGAVLAPARRSALLAWAAARQAVVVEDDNDAEFRYDRSPVGALQGCRPTGSSTGAACPRRWHRVCGWAGSWRRRGLAPTVAGTKFLADIAAPVVDQVTLAILIETGALDRHVRGVAARYAANRDQLLAAVARHLPQWTVTGIAAGLHAVLTPATTIPATALQHAAEQERDLDIVPLVAFNHGDRPRSGLVVGYGAATAGQIDRGVAALATRLASSVSGRTVR